jgi:hypothetical protein
MPSYADSLSEQERWGLAYYVLSLAGKPAPAPVPQEVTTIVSRFVNAAIPTDPSAGFWKQEKRAAILTRTLWLRPKQVEAVRVASLHNGKEIGLLLEWDDSAMNEETLRHEDFRDAAAIQFPLQSGEPSYIMGEQKGPVNIWHWKADWQADITARQDMNALYPNMHVDQYPFTSAVDPLAVAAADYLDPNYLPALASGNLFASATRVSPVEDVIAGGFGSLTAQPADGQNVQGHGAWADGKWRVIFTRDLTSQEADDVVFVPGQVYSLAFAAWDGANGERNGQKSTSQWVSLQLGAPAAAPRPAETAAAPFDMLGMLYVFGPMVLVAGLITGLAGAVYLLSLLAKPADRS